MGRPPTERPGALTDGTSARLADTLGSVIVIAGEGDVNLSSSTGIAHVPYA